MLQPKSLSIVGPVAHLEWLAGAQGGKVWEGSREEDVDDSRPPSLVHLSFLTILL